MEYRIEKKDGFKFYGMKRKFCTINGENFIKIHNFGTKRWEMGITKEC